MAHRSRVGLRNTQVPGPFYSGNFFNKDPDLLFHRFHPEEYIVLPLKVRKKGHFKYNFSTLQLKEPLAPFLVLFMVIEVLHLSKFSFFLTQKMNEKKYLVCMMKRPKKKRLLSQYNIYFISIKFISNSNNMDLTAIKVGT